MKVYSEMKLKPIQKDVYIFVTDSEKLEPGTKGIAKIKYPEGSIYTGPVEFTGKTFEKIGYGRQDFTSSYISCDDVGGPADDTLYLYEGMFDYKETQWIYGDGIFYFLKDGKPDCYFPGFFRGTDFDKEYQGKDLDSLLLPSFKNTKRLQFLLPKQKRINSMLDAAKANPAEFMFVGDSYFDFLNTHFDQDNKSLFEHYSKGNKTFNAGIGGFRFCDFNKFIYKLICAGQPNSIIVNLGFNDIHSGYSLEKVYQDCQKFLELVFQAKADTHVYLLTVSHFPAFPRFRNIEDQYNQIIYNLEKDKRITIIDAASAFEEVKEKGEDFSSYIEDDLIHPNNKGYSIWMPKILKEVKSYKL